MTIRSWLGDAFIDAIFALSKRQEVLGLPVRHFMPDDLDGAKQMAIVTTALHLLHDWDAKRFARMKRDLSGIWLIGIPGFGEYDAKRRLCRIDPDYILKYDRTPEAVASTIVHEATHARLEQCGIRYVAKDRQRIEHVCIKAQLAFGRRLPDGAAVVAAAEKELQRPAADWSNDSLRADRIRRLRELDAPGWWIRWLERRDKPAA